MESQDCLITLEIYEPLRQVGKDIYCVDGEWEKTAFKRRMTVVKLSSGDLVLHSPIRMYEADLEALARIPRSPAIRN